MNISEIIYEQRTSDAFVEVLEIIMQRLQRSEEQIKQIEAYTKKHEKKLMKQYTKMVKDAQENDTALPFYDVWTIAMADEALFG